MRARWGEIVAFGLLLIVLGVAAMAFTLPSTVATVTLNGVFFLVAGAAEIGVGAHAKSWARFFLWMHRRRALSDRRRDLHHQSYLRLACADAGAGRRPDRGGRGARVSRLSAAGRQPARLVLLAAAITFLLGLVIVVHWPTDRVYVLGTLLGVDLLFHGVGWATFGFASGRAAERAERSPGRSERKKPTILAAVRRLIGGANFFAGLIVVMNGRADCG